MGGLGRGSTWCSLASSSQLRRSWIILRMITGGLWRLSIGGYALFLKPMRENDYRVLFAVYDEIIKHFEEQGEVCILHYVVTQYAESVQYVSDN